MKKEDIRLRAAELFDIPADTRGGLIHIEMTGNREVYVENHKGILALGEDEIILNAGKQTVRIIGKGLRVLAMNSCEIRLSGTVDSINFDI